MSGKGFILLLKSNGKYDAIYCYHLMKDTANKLCENYNTKEKVEQLIRMGDIYYLQENIENTVFGHRDFNGDLSIMRDVDLSELENYISDCDFVFENEQWRIISRN